MLPNLLYKTKCYLVGNLEGVSQTEGENWRKEASIALTQMGVTILNPLKKPFTTSFQDGREEIVENKKLKANSNFLELSSRMKKIRSYDLSLVDKSDFLIAFLYPESMACGSWEEIFEANRSKKPIFFTSIGGIRACPNWIFGTIPYEYIYDDLPSILKILQELDAGVRPFDEARWRLLKREYR